MGIEKVCKKSMALWKHGKHKGLEQESIKRNRVKEEEDKRRGSRSDFKEPKELFKELR